VGRKTPGFNFLGFNIQAVEVDKYQTGSNTYGIPPRLQDNYHPNKEKAKRYITTS